MSLNELHLFAGAGGGILGGMLLGHATVCAVEIEPYCREILLQRQRDGILPRFPIWDDVSTFDGKPWRGRVDVVCGGFPCQDISVAGNGAGIDGSRSGLWGQMARIVGEVLPDYVFVENSPALAFRGLGRVLGDLSEMGYNARWSVMGADDVGAPHIRKRIWILGYADGHGKPTGAIDAETSGLPSDISQAKGAGAVRDHGRLWPRPSGIDRRQGTTAVEMGYTKEKRLQRQWPYWLEESQSYVSKKISMCPSEILANAQNYGLGWGKQQPESGEEKRNVAEAKSVNDCGIGKSRWPTEPDMGRVANGVAKRVDRLKAIGNGQVPRVAAAAWRMLIQE